MKPRIALVAIPLCLFITGSARAEGAITFKSFFHGLTNSIPIPPEWSGVWANVDSSYDCTTLALKSVNANNDTLCQGQQAFAPSSGLPFAIDCTGTADANSVHIHCSGSGLIITGCTASIDIQLDGTLTGDTYYAVNTTNITYTGAGCLGIPNSCTLVHSRATRISAQPATCATPTQPSTWGKVKAYYR
jgi:hypothetical protein